MREIFLLRDFDPPITAEDVRTGAAESGWCLEMHRVDWCGSFLAAGGKRMLCRFRAADIESARLGLALAGADLRVLWGGTVHDAPEGVEPNVIVERSFAEPIELAAVQAIEDAGAWCLAAHDVRFARTFFSLDQRRMICLYGAPDAEAVRRAQREAQMPHDAVWSFAYVPPLEPPQSPSS